MRSGTWIVLLFAAFAALAFALFRLYGSRVIAPDTPLRAAESFVRADNTAVGLLGGIRDFRPIEVREAEPGGVAIRAAVRGARDSGTLYSDLSAADGRWAVVRAALVLSGGDRIPLAGSRPATLEPAPSRSRDPGRRGSGVVRNRTEPPRRTGHNGATAEEILGSTTERWIMEPAAKRFHVMPEGDGREWIVRLEESMDDAARASTREDAIERGAEIARQEKAELVIHGADGAIEEERVFA